MNEKELTIFELTEESIESMIYEIRSQRVMLDFDLARIYGYETKYLNRQVQRNIDKFPNDFMFELSDAETDSILRCQNVTANGISSKRRYNPYAFTEQGIYMLMTVLKGELAIKQSKSLIRLFKRMKDYIIENNELINYNASLINNKFASYDKRFEKVEEKLEVVMDNFIDPSTYKHFLILNGQKLEADIAYQQIYSLAKHSIIIIDDYIEIKTLDLLRVICEKVNVVIISDNKAKNKLTVSTINDFLSDTCINITFVPNNSLFHDRYVFIDLDTDNEKLFCSGPSSKDAGKRIGTIMQIEKVEQYKELIKAKI